LAATLLLDQTTWDLVLDANGNIALATEPYSQAQDAASAIKTFLGECWWDTTVGIPYLTQVLGQSPPLTYLKELLQNAALTVQGVVAATAYISSFTDREVSGQVQIINSSGQTAAANFTVVNPQGSG
jgi:hypothetical protein